MFTRVLAWSAAGLWLRNLWRHSTWFKTLAIAVIAVLAISWGHHEYLTYAAATGSTEHVWLSFILKWSLIGTTCLIALFTLIRRRRRYLLPNQSQPVSKTETYSEKEPLGVNFDKPRSAAERILGEHPP